MSEFTEDTLLSMLQPYVPNVKVLSGDAMSLNRMQELLERLGNPQNSLKIIHIAGTSGKTSTSYYIRDLLEASGKRTGLTVSPHIDSVTERIQISGASLPVEKFGEYLSECIELVQGIPCSYFELLIALAYWVFLQEEVDYAVVETGMGGLLDGTNVANRSDKICVITDIGFDHMHILGNTIPEIALQKAGIIHRGNQCFMHVQSDDINRVVQQFALQVGGHVHLVEQHTSLHTTMPLYQQRNWDLAYTAMLYLAHRDVFTLSKVFNPLATYIPARMDPVKLPDGSYVLMDGAHNQQKMAAFVASFQALFPDQKAVVLCALKEGKEGQEVLAELAPITHSLVCTSFKGSQDLPVQSQDPQQLAELATTIGISAQVIEDSQSALDVVLKTPGIKIITGSFYLIAQLRRSLL